MTRFRSQGYTLIELMIAMSLGLLMGVAIITVFLEARHSFDRDESIQRMQDDARQAIRDLTNDVSMAGYWADLLLPAAIVPDATLTVAASPDPCGPASAAGVEWIYQTVEPGTTQSVAVLAVDNATGATANAAFSCIAAGEIVPGTDVISVKRVAGTGLGGAPAADTVYLRSNGTLGLLYKAPLGAPAVNVPPPFTDWEYRPSIYYVRNYAVTAGDGIPTLCRKVLVFGSPPTMTTECLAQGIENLQIEYGLDSTGDGRPDVYIPNPDLAQLQMAVSAQIYVLARSADRDLRYDNEKTYSISNAPAYTPADDFYRRVFTVTVNMRNLRALRAFQS